VCILSDNGGWRKQCVGGNKEFIYMYAICVGAGLLTLLTPELNPSAQRCLTRYFTGDFAF
jgi:hypothetical protein